MKKVLGRGGALRKGKEGGKRGEEREGTGAWSLGGSQGGVRGGPLEA